MSHQVTSLVQFSVFRRPSKTSVLPSFPKQQVVRLRDYFQTMDPCGGENWAYSRIVCSGWKWLFDGLIVNAGTSWSSAYLQVYTRASSCAWTHQKYAPFEVRIITIVHELWLTIHLVFRLFRDDWGPIYSLSTLNGRAWVFDTDTLSGENSRASWLPKLSLVLPFAPFTIKMSWIPLQ